MNYLYWKTKAGRNICRLEALQNVEKDFQLRRGISRINDFPNDACYHMSKNFKTYIKLQDSLKNIGGLLVVSNMLKDFLERENLKNNEFLLITIFNHKGRAIKETYWILHQVELQDCIDRDKSQYEIHDLDPGFLSFVRKLVLDETKIDPEVTLFRLKSYPNLVIIRKDLAEKITKAGFTGISFEEIENYRD